VKNLKIALILSILILSVGSGIASAHPPRGVSLSWDPSGKLTVNVDHSVNDPQKHYIGKIIVYVNDKIVAQKEYSSQTSGEAQADTFDLGALPAGTNIKAEAFCVIMGSAAGAIAVR
jgi:hypothetical protein